MLSIYTPEAAMGQSLTRAAIILLSAKLGLTHSLELTSNYIIKQKNLSGLDPDGLS